MSGKTSVLLFIWIYCIVETRCTTQKDAIKVVNRLADQVRAVLEYYKNNSDPVGLPDTVYKILDPMPIPTIELISTHLFTLRMLNCSVYGLSKSRIETVHTNLTANPQVIAEVKIESLEVRGNYTLTSLFSREVYGCVVNMKNVNVASLIEMGLSNQGDLVASNIDMDITVGKIKIDFQNIGFLALLFQDMINKMDIFVFNTIKPFILTEVKFLMREEINKAARRIELTFPNSITPLDFAIAEARATVVSLGYDLYMFPDYSQSAGMFGIYMTNMWVSGLGSFYRVGNMTVSLQNNMVQVGFSVGTDELVGNCHWELSAAGLYSHPGTTSFTVEYVQVEIKLNQTLDMSSPPALESLDMTLGNIQLRNEGTGTMDYVMELLVNILPNLLRYQIINAIRDPLRQRFQDILDAVDVEKALNEEIRKLEKMILKNDALKQTDRAANLVSTISRESEDYDYSCNLVSCEY